MKRLFLLLAILFACSVSGTAQTQIQSGPTDPATCNSNVGQLFYNTTSSTMKTCSATNTWTAIGGGTGTTGSGAAPVMAIYMSPNCPVSNTGSCINTFADTVQVNDCGWTTGGPTVTCTTPHFTSADVGKSAMGGQTCAADTFYSPTANGAISQTALVTIAGFTDSTHITLSSTPANASTAGTNAGGCFIYGHPDDPAAVIIDALVAAALNCPKIELPASYYLFQSPHFFTQPAGCTNSSPVVGSSFGNVILPSGFTVEGRLPGVSTIFLAPSFPNGDLCNHKASSGVASGSCFTIPIEGTWRGIMLNGGFQYLAPQMAGLNLLSASIANIDHVMCINEGAGNANITGLIYSFQVFIDQYDNSGCGGIGMQSDANGAAGNIWYRAVVEDSGTTALNMTVAGGDISCFGCNFSMPQSGITNKITVTNASNGTLRMYGGKILPANIAASSNAGMTLYKDTGGGSLFADSTFFQGNIGSGSNNNAGLWCAAAGCKISVINGSALQSQSAAFAYADTAGGTLYIDSSSTTTTPFSNGAISGSIAAEGHSLFGSCTGTALAAGGTFGLYGTGPNITSTTCGGLSAGTVGAGVVASKNGTLQSLIVTATGAGSGAGSGVVTVMKNGATTTLVCTIGTGTSCNDYAHTAAFVKGDLISIQFTAAVSDALAGVKALALW
jgi:hypothetical protein